MNLFLAALLGIWLFSGLIASFLVVIVVGAMRDGGAGVKLSRAVLLCVAAFLFGPLALFVLPFSFFVYSKIRETAEAKVKEENEQ